MFSTADIMPTAGASIRLAADRSDGCRLVHELSNALTVLGSGRCCDVELEVGGIDDAQTAIVKLGGCAYVCDLRAAGGTLLNGRRVRWARLSTGDHLGVGPYAFRVEVCEAFAEAVEERPIFSLRNDQTVGTLTSIDPVLVIGSDPRCDVVLPPGSVVPRHCVLVWTHEGPILRDLQSRLCTRVNGRVGRILRLLNGDEVAIGTHRLIFETSLGALVGPDQSASVVGSGGGAHRDTRPVSELIAARCDWPSEWELTQLTEAVVPEAGPLQPNAEVEPEGRGKPESQAMEQNSSRPASRELEQMDPPAAAAEVEPDDGEIAECSEGESGDVSLEVRVARLERRNAVIEARLIAAQRALDKHSRRYRETLSDERMKVDARRRELQRHAQKLRQVFGEGAHLPRSDRRPIVDELDRINEWLDGLSEGGAEDPRCLEIDRAFEAVERRLFELPRQAVRTGDRTRGSAPRANGKSAGRGTEGLAARTDSDRGHGKFGRREAMAVAGSAPPAVSHCSESHQGMPRLASLLGRIEQTAQASRVKLESLEQSVDALDFRLSDESRSLPPRVSKRAVQEPGQPVGSKP